MKLGMHEVFECALCGADTLPNSEISYVIGEHTALCFECAIRCGGVYDDTRHSWTVLPTMHGIPLDPREPWTRRFRAVPQRAGTSA